MRTLIRDGLLLTQNAQRDIVRGSLLIEGDRIAAVGEVPEGPVDRVIDARGHLVIPGLINLHTHLPMTLLRGVGDDLPLEEWLRTRIWPVEAHLTAAEVKAGARLALLEMIAGGTTCFNDMYFFADAVAEAAAEAGVRGFVASVFLDFPTPELTPDRMESEARRFHARWAGHPLITPTLGPHATYTCSDKTLQTVARLQQEFGGCLVHTHCSETRTEVYDVEAKTGHRPVAQLARHGLLGERTVLAHCGWITKEEVRALGASGAGIAHCPVSNFKLATGGWLPLPELWEAKVAVGTGTDGAASNNTLSLFETMKFMALGQKQHRWDARVAPAQRVFDAATREGARALGALDRLGSLEVGKQADVVLIDVRKPHLTPLTDPVSHLVYAVGAQDVRTVLVAGKPLLLEGRFETLDAAKVMAEAQAAAEALLQKAGVRPGAAQQGI
ncbi:MAG TPA: amidohydrolase [Candidatus Thermoplasmatota archaeon]|nr:amidohydrolase [Candidatus Thermoplasmatota archaeon]